MARRSNEGILITVLVLGFLGVALWLISRSTPNLEIEPPMSTYSARPEGTKALYELARSQGIELERFFDSEYDYPPGSAVLILDSPDFELPLMLGSPFNQTALRLWVENGGRLLIFSIPMRGIGPELFNEMDQAEGLTTEDFSFWDLGQAQGHQGGSQRHRVADPQVIAKQQAVSGGSGQMTALWTIYNPGLVYELNEPRPKLWADVTSLEVADAVVPPVNGHVLLATSASADPVVIHRRFGEGEVIWVPRPEIAANSWIDRYDNHRVVLALLDYIAAGETVYVDEHIHGFRRRQLTVPAMLFGTRGGVLILILCGVVLLAFLGRAIPPARFKSRAVPHRRQATEMVLAQADLYRRAGAWQSVADSLVDGVKRGCMSALHEPRPMTNEELNGWLGSRETDSRNRYPVLRRYLEQRGEIRPREITQLARECDQLYAALEQGGADNPGS